MNPSFTASGLTASKAYELLHEHGPNKLPEKPKPSSAELLLAQLKSPLVYVLLLASIVTFFLREFSDAAIILMVVSINTVLGFVQEKRAGDSLDALKKLLHPEAVVIRDNQRVKIPTEEIVPGDVVVLNAGDKVPADGRILSANRFFADEAVLTGESVPVEKNNDSKVFMGTVVASGQGLMKVTHTGAATEMGRIAHDVQTLGDESPLAKQLKVFSKQLTVLVVGVTLFVMVIGVYAGMDLVEIFVTSVALAVSAIPEGLLVALTVVLAIGMQRILKRKGLVRNLVSAETLGGVTVICTDKTGTLTQGKMQVVEVYGDEEGLRLQSVVANDMDDPMVIAAGAWGGQKYAETEGILKQYQRFDSLPFTSEERVFVSLNKLDDEHNIVFVNGAPELLLAHSINVSSDEKEVIKKRIQDLSSKGFRLIGYAQRKFKNDKITVNIEDSKAELHWVGLLAFSDPVRTDVKDALEKTQLAGIKLLVITGDYATTAVSVMQQLGLNVKQENILLGDNIEKMSHEEICAFLKNTNDPRLFARTKPHHKSRIVNALKENGEVVAMMGDGVNDAPALKRSDIGIVVGEASDVAKETADLVLLDSSFSTIVAAIEEGRGIFDNIRKVILYLMCDAFGEIFAIILALIFRVPLPITASQILWVNVVSDGFPSIALTIDPKSKNIMKLPPRSPKVPLVANWMKVLMLTVSLIAGVSTFLLYMYIFTTTGDIVYARSVAFAAFGVNSLVYVFSIRILREPFWNEKLFANKPLILAVFGGAFLQVVPYIFEPTRRFFNIVPIGNMWFAVVGIALLMFITVEIFKYFFKKFQSA